MPLGDDGTQQTNHLSGALPWRRSGTRRNHAAPVRAEKTGVTIPYPNTQPVPAIAAVTPPRARPGRG
ncbi:hypothetical protein GCM10029963_37050 [Micromonospora andamanensis]